MKRQIELRGRKVDLQTVLDTLIDSVIIIDDRGRIIECNDAVFGQLGYQREELVGREVTVLMPEPHATNHQNYIDQYLATGERKIIGIGRHVCARHKDGSLLDVSLAISETRDDLGPVFVGVLRDITHQVQREQELQRNHDEYLIQTKVNKIIQSAYDPKQLLDSILATLIEMAELEVQSKAGLFLVSPQHADENPDYHRPVDTHSPKGLQLVKTIGHFSEEFLQHEAWIPLGACLCGRSAASGEVIVSGNCFKDSRHEHRFTGMQPHGHYIIPLSSGQKVLGVIFLYTDPDPAWDERRIGLFQTLGTEIGLALDRLWSLSELHASREQLYRLAARDALTDLLNRRAILKRLSEEFTRSERHNKSVGLIILDIDHFKKINDNYGHPVGDDVLVEAARRLEQSVRPYDVVGRLGGEEFLIIVPEADVKTTCEVAERIREETAAKPIVTRNGHELAITVSLGVTVTSNLADQRESVENVIERADAALYRAKESGRNRVEVAPAPR